MNPCAFDNRKPSGVLWLGSIPASWDCVALKYRAEIIMGQSPPSEEYANDPEQLPFLQGNAEFGALSPTARWFCDVAPKRAPAGSILLSVRAPVGALNWADRTYGIGRGLCSVVAKASSANPQFIKYALEAAKPLLEAEATGSTFTAISADEVGNFSLAFPILIQQQQIADFLDLRTAKIDDLIAKKRELIERLREKRTALISHVVTKGLPPGEAAKHGFPVNPPLKPSGVPWLGDIPEHWEVVKFSREVFIAEGQVDPEKEPYVDMVLIGPEHIESGTGKILRMESAREQSAESGKYLCKAGDVVYSKIRPALRKVVIAPVDSLCSADMYPLRSRGRVVHAYLYYFMLSEEFAGWSMLESDRVAMPKLNRDTLNELRFCLPSPKDQREIAIYLDGRLARLDQLTQSLLSTVHTLQEFRSALITAAVTGKIDVRKSTKETS